MVNEINKFKNLESLLRELEKKLQIHVDDIVQLINFIYNMARLRQLLD
ncbi:unnamed protein product [Paramecium sonneborni]|uniref:Uncharacterized protein n=1 Tax=Paramecium sonneborni TaxID=65129 RepID=A0A8S1RRL7_9CILI|nr:unnamed protein product [Paramecium sonneborni]